MANQINTFVYLQSQYILIDGIAQSDLILLWLVGLAVISAMYLVSIIDLLLYTNSELHFVTNMTSPWT